MHKRVCKTCGDVKFVVRDNRDKLCMSCSARERMVKRLDNYSKKKYFRVCRICGNSKQISKGGVRLLSRCRPCSKREEMEKEWQVKNPEFKNFNWERTENRVVLRTVCVDCKKEILIDRSKLIKDKKNNKFLSRCHKCVQSFLVGKNHPMYCGELVKKGKYVYIRIDNKSIYSSMSCGSHPEGMVSIPLHRYVVATKIGRPLTRNEHVHHIDGNKMNNDIKNLAIMTPSQHTLITQMEIERNMWKKKYEDLIANNIT